MPGAPLESFVDPVPDPLHCLICQEAAYPPLLACKSDHLLCGDCWGNLRARPRAQRKCPTCRAPLFKRAKENVVSKRVLESLKYKCSHAKEGCEWVGSVGEESKHAASCAYRDVRCNACAAVLQARCLGTHTSTCSQWPIACPNNESGSCGTNKRRNMPAHLLVCPYVKCTNYEHSKTTTTKKLMVIHKPACDALCAREADRNRSARRAPPASPSSSDSSDTTDGSSTVATLVSDSSDSSGLSDSDLDSSSESD